MIKTYILIGIVFNGTFSSMQEHCGIKAQKPRRGGIVVQMTSLVWKERGSDSRPMR